MSVEAFGEQEAIGRDAQTGRAMEAAPATPFAVVESEFLFELLVVALDSPALMRHIDPFVERAGAWKRRQVVLRRRRLIVRPFDRQPLLPPQASTPDIAAGMADLHRGKAAGQHLVPSLAPAHGLVRRFRKGPCQRLDAQGLPFRSASRLYRRTPATAILPNCSAVLPRHTHRALPLLRKPAVVDDPEAAHLQSFGLIHSRTRRSISSSDHPDLATK